MRAAHMHRSAFQLPHPMRLPPWLAASSRRTCHRPRTHHPHLLLINGTRVRPTCVDTSVHTSSSHTAPFDAQSCALQRGIKAVAVGKHGSKPVPPELLPAIHAELERCRHDAQPELLWLRASFLGSLFVKNELTVDEMRVLVRWCADGASIAGRRREVAQLCISAGEVLSSVSSQHSELSVFAMRVLCDERLDQREAEMLGKLLYSEHGDWALKALIAHVMRVRHEDEHELAGLCVAARRSVKQHFHGMPRSAHVYALLAEPFDGTQAWELLTPLIARHLHEQYGMRVVLAVGESSGPKYGPNLRDVARELDVCFARDGTQLLKAFDEGAAMVAVDQRDVSDGLHAWVAMRRVIVKRPAIASAEKFADAVPHGCDVFIGSAFHDSYLDKMAAAAEANGYGAYVIVGKGMEGTIGLGVNSSRVALLLSGWRSVNGKYSRKAVRFNAREHGLDDEQRRERGEASAAATARLVRAFEIDGSSGDVLFDRRAAATVKALDEVLRAMRDDGWSALEADRLA